MIAAIVQARMGSTRLPNKVLKDLCGRPLVWQVINRVKASRKIDKIILATTQNPNDAALENWAGENDIPCYRGSEDDVLDRFYNAARLFKADVIVRITPDDPFKDPAIIDQVIDLFEEEKLDFAYNNKPATFPEGLDTEVFSFQALERAWTEAKDPFEREHVTQYFYRHPELFRQKCLIHPKTSHISDGPLIRRRIGIWQKWSIRSFFRRTAIFPWPTSLSSCEGDRRSRW